MKPSAGCRSDAERRNGMVLLVVLVVVAMLTIANLAYFDWAFVEHRASGAATRRVQTEAAADSGAEYLRAYLANDAATIASDGGWYDNAARFRGMLLTDGYAPSLRLRVSIVAPKWGTLAIEGARFGLEDDSGRLNLNTLVVADKREPGAGRQLLRSLPAMTDPIADAILDWVDEDSEVRELGAESEHYSSLVSPYAPTNGPLRAIEELLLVKGVNAALLWGVDQDRNHTAEPLEATAMTFVDFDNASGELNGGWASLVTITSAERNLRDDGTPRINVNQEDLQTLHDQVSQALGPEAANFVVAYRQGGPEELPTADNAFTVDGAATDQPTPVDTIGSAAAATGQGATGQAAGQGGAGALVAGAEQVKNAASISIDFTQPGSTPIGSLLELVGVRARVVEKNQASGQTLVESPFAEDSGTLRDTLARLFEALTTVESPTIPGRLNVNQAPRTLLAGTPGMPPEVVDAILAARDAAGADQRTDRNSASWLLAEGVVTLEQMRALEPYLCGRGDVYRAQVVGAFEEDGPACRLEVVVDASGAAPRVVERRDLSPMGQGFSAEVLAGAAQTAP
ncbi:MAG: general secretion pathway protein GspK [Lacipirellulaceae bacterium]